MLKYPDYWKDKALKMYVFDIKYFIHLCAIIEKLLVSINKGVIIISINNLKNYCAR